MAFRAGPTGRPKTVRSGRDPSPMASAAGADAGLSAPRFRIPRAQASGSLADQKFQHPAPWGIWRSHLGDEHPFATVFLMFTRGFLGFDPQPAVDGFFPTAQKLSIASGHRGISHVDMLRSCRWWLQTKDQSWLLDGGFSFKEKYVFAGRNTSRKEFLTSRGGGGL